MAGFSRFLEAKLLDQMFGNKPYDPPATYYIALLTKPPVDTDIGESLQEATYIAYKRKGIENRPTNWERTDGNHVTNFFLIEFERSQGGVSLITHFALCDSSIAGNVIATGKLSTQKEITEGDRPEFPPNTLSFELS